MMIEREERDTFDQRGRDDHGRLDVAGRLRLAGHALDGRLGQAADAHAAPMITRPAPIGPEVGERAA